MPEDRIQFCRTVASEFKDSGIKFVRIWFQWNFFEERVQTDSNNQPLQFPLDDFVTAMRESSIAVLGVVGNGYSRFLPEGLDLESAEGYVTKLDASARAIVSHYRDSIQLWQIENEPNWWEEHYAVGWRKGGIWFKPGMQDSILRVLHDAVMQENPDSLIVINLEADKKTTDWKLYAEYCDVIGLDFYPNYSHASPVDASELRFCEEVRAATGKPVFVSETGYPSWPSFLGYDEPKQALYVESACDVAYATDAITGLSIWRYSDNDWRSFPFQENHFGLLAEDGRRKPSWSEYINFVKGH
jgi:hypothetical protein